LTESIISSHESAEDVKYVNALRPSTIEEYIGQKNNIEKVQTTIEAAKQRGEAVEHILIGGSAGKGKTTLSYLLADIYGTSCVCVNSVSIKNINDIARLVMKMEENHFLFLDEIHRLNIRFQEMLYTIMEDGVLEVRSANDELRRIKVKPFTLVGASTNIGKLSAPIRDRFGVKLTIEDYTQEELTKIILNSSEKIQCSLNEDLAKLIAIRSRGTPRIANRLLKRVRDHAQVHNNNTITEQVINDSMEKEGIDPYGYTKLDLEYLKVLKNQYGGGPAGLMALAATLKTDGQTIRDDVEPYLMSEKLLVISRRGREMTTKGNVFYEKIQ